MPASDIPNAALDKYILQLALNRQKASDKYSQSAVLDTNTQVLHSQQVVWYKLVLGMLALDKLELCIQASDNNLLDNDSRFQYAHIQPLRMFQCM